MRTVLPLHLQLQTLLIGFLHLQVLVNIGSNLLVMVEQLNKYLLTLVELEHTLALLMTMVFGLELDMILLTIHALMHGEDNLD